MPPSPRPRRRRCPDRLHLARGRQGEHPGGDRARRRGGDRWRQARPPRTTPRSTPQARAHGVDVISSGNFSITGGHGPGRRGPRGSPFLPRAEIIDYAQRHEGRRPERDLARAGRADRRGRPAASPDRSTRSTGPPRRAARLVGRTSTVHSDRFRGSRSKESIDEAGVGIRIALAILDGACGRGSPARRAHAPSRSRGAPFRTSITVAAGWRAGSKITSVRGKRAR